MFAKKGITPWWEMFEIVVKSGDKQIRTRCGASSVPSPDGVYRPCTEYVCVCFEVPAGTPGLLELAETEAPAEVECDGIKYRVFRYRFGPHTHGYIGVYGEPVGSVSAKPSVQDQIVGALRAAPNGLTARQIGEALGFTTRWVFSALAALTKSGQVTKDGPLYRIGVKSQEHAPCAL